MNMQKIIAAIIVLASAVLTAYVSKDMAFPSILCMLGLLGIKRRFILDIKPQRRAVTSLLLLCLLLIFAIQYRYGIIPGSGGDEPTALDAWRTVTRYFMAAMILVLYLGPADYLPPSLGLFHLAIIVSGGQILLLDGWETQFRLLELGSVLLVMFYIITSQQSPRDHLLGTHSRCTALWLTRFVVLFITVNLGWIFSSILYQNQGVITSLGSRFWGEQINILPASGQINSIGFSQSGRLSNLLLLKEDQNTDPVLTITCEGAPGYLRTRAFDVYRQSVWQDLSYREQLWPQEKKSLGMKLSGMRHIFHLSRTEISGTETMTIRQQGGFDDCLFIPLNAVYADIPATVLLRDDNDIIYAPQAGCNNYYRIAYSLIPVHKKLNPTQNRRSLDIPPDLDNRIKQLAGRLFQNCQTTSDKIQAVIQHFRDNYTYSLNPRIPSIQDKLSYFLLNGTSGYCEYFASGAALLLRVGGVPARYITGFLVTERDLDTSTWIARNKDAHAWVEAWDEQRQRWTIVEATVQQELYESATHIGNEFDSTGVIFLRQLYDVFFHYGFIGLVIWLLAYGGFFVVLPLAILIALLCLIPLRRYTRLQRHISQQHPRISDNQQIQAMQRLLKKADRRVRKTGLERYPSETLQGFSRRLAEQAPLETRIYQWAQWYQRYAAIRYCRDILTQDLQGLSQGLRGLL